MGNGGGRLRVACVLRGQAVELTAIPFSGGYAMRKPYYFAAMLVLVMNSISPAQAPSTSGQTSARAANKETVATLAKANNRFAVDLLHKLSANTSENAFFSPYSISAALAMTWAGARTET